MNNISLQKLKAFLLRNKKATGGAVLALAALSFFVFGSGGSKNVNVYAVQYSDLANTVRATGQVVSNTDLDLSFNKSGIVRSVKVRVGDKVQIGEVLATLDQGQVLAAVTQAKGALLSAQAKYSKVLEGASNEEIILAEVSLKNAQIDLENIKNTNNALVSSAYKTMLNSYPAAFSDFSFSTASAPTITGTYVYEKEGDIKITTYQGGSWRFDTSGLVQSSGHASDTSPQPIGDSGLYIQFAPGSQSNGYWTITIPNKKASNYLTNYNAYKNAIQTQTSAVSSAQSLVDQRKAELDLKKASATNADLDIARAEVLSAEGNLQSAQSAYEDSIIKAPAGGTITKVDIKYGELAEVSKPSITLEDVENLYIEALINEANIAYLKVGQAVSIDFDAFGNDKKFFGTIVHIDPAADANDGVVNYKIKVSISGKDETIRPGMNANISILAGEAKNVLSVPKVAVFKKEEKSFVKILIGDKHTKMQEREVETGFVGDSNMVQIISGLLEGDTVVFDQK